MPSLIDVEIHADTFLLASYADALWAFHAIFHLHRRLHLHGLSSNIQESLGHSLESPGLPYRPPNLLLFPGKCLKSTFSHLFWPIYGVLRGEDCLLYVEPSQILICLGWHL